ncbi:Transcriptional activator of the JUN family [Handroanthus impetiginosus]|uniref:Transcriptional activator of the JUN family n=1 Tax=Handroanthus impetiginosus TaxID=429701 RepID=A0A2G9I6Q3_9LAMI|nr:Transcriptional activator of the JUN family [Handroanthus impetiginosus]
MASHRLGEPSLSDSGHHISYALPHMLHHPSTSFINQEGSSSAFDFGELEEAIVLQGVKINNDDTKQPLYTTVRPAATLEMFPSWPMRFQQHPPRGSSKSGEESTDSGSGVNTLSTTRLEPESPISRKPAAVDHTRHHLQPPPPPQMDAASGGDSPVSQTQPPTKQPSEKRRGPGSNSEKVLDAKTLRRLAQNREAARKSRLRKKAYVQQLESSRIRLTQLEQDLQRARSQVTYNGLFLGGGVVASGNISSGGAIFDMEYARWLDDDHRHMSELRTALQAHLSDGDLRVIIDGYIAHFDEIFRLKGIAAKSDVFHLITGMWTTPAERCFLWMGGFRPSDLIKMLIAQLDPLTEQQVMGIYGLQQSTQQAEEALSQGLEQLQQSLIDTIASGSVNDSMHHMAVALGKLANLEGFVRQADNLSQHTLHQLRRILTVRQAARCFLVIGEYYGRLRALSSLWASRPREAMIADDNSCQTSTDLHMVQSSQNQFSNF